MAAVPEGRRTRYHLADRRLVHALDDLLGLVLAAVSLAAVNVAFGWWLADGAAVVIAAVAVKEGRDAWHG